VPRTSRAAVLVAPRQLKVVEMPVPDLTDETGLLRVESCGICGSDASKFTGTLGAWQKFDLVLGHEIVGVIERVGDVAARRWNVRPGDRVAVEPFVPCAHCRACLTGNYPQCTGWGRMLSYGTVERSCPPGLWGGFAEYLPLHPNTVLHHVDPRVPADLAVLFNPLAAGVKWSVTAAGTRSGDTVVVLGPGQRGLACVVALRAAGAGPVIVTGLPADDYKLALARDLGADHAIDVSRADLRERVRAITSGQGADVVIDTTPKSADAVTDALHIAGTGGTVVLAGIKGNHLVETFDADLVIAKELTIKGMYATDHLSFTRALRIIGLRPPGLERLHTHSFGLDDAAEALRMLAGDVPGSNAINIVVHPHD
jgi:threonine dehydrogenase-like Zn-dependent dehydrogenase